jgi:uncharacterized coiled-coil protein SlyX
VSSRPFLGRATWGRAAVLALSAAALVTAEARAARAQAAGEAATVEELRRTVEGLRRTVEDLQRQMRELEQRLAASPPTQVPAPEPPRIAETAPAPAPPTAAPGQIQVSEEAAATALERALVQRGAALLPSGAVQVEPSLSLVRLEADEPAFLVQGAGGGVASTVAVQGSRERESRLTAGLGLRIGLPLEAQLTLDMPYRYVDTSIVGRAASGELRDRGRDVAGFGDLAVSLDKQLLRERGWLPDLVAGLTWNTDTGQTEHGVDLGSGFDEITAGLTASKSQDPLVFVAGLSYTHAFEEGGVEPGDVYGLSLGAVLAASPETSLRFFFDQGFVERAEIDGQGVSGSDTWVGLLSIGASSILSRRVLLDAELGIGLTENAPDYTFRVALPIQFDLPPLLASAMRR